MNEIIVVAGATGNLGGRIIKYLVEAGAEVRAITRTGSDTSALNSSGAKIFTIDYNDDDALQTVCKGASCIVSAVSGLGDVIVGSQIQLIQAAISAGVPRFIPSDFSIDFTKLPVGSNRNLDLRREFHNIINSAPIKATSIFNGMFMDLLTGQAPVILFKWKRIVYWGDKNQLLDFTTIDNTAQFTAEAALDQHTPRYLHIAGESASAKDLQRIAGKVTEQEFKLFRPGGLGGLKTMINITKALFPKKEEIFPPWQGMQYMHNMFTGLPRPTKLDNDRYPNIKWTTVAELISS